MQDEGFLDNFIENILLHDTDWLEWLTESHIVEGLQESCSKPQQNDSEEKDTISSTSPRQSRDTKHCEMKNGESFDWGNTAPNLASRVWSIRNTECCSCGIRKPKENKDPMGAASDVGIVLFSVDQSKSGGTLYVAKRVWGSWFKRPILSWSRCKKCGKASGSIMLCQKPSDLVKKAGSQRGHRSLRGWREIMNLALLNQIAQHVENEYASTTTIRTGVIINSSAPGTALCGEEL